MSRFYAGIGSRETPDAYLVVMREIAIKLALQGMTLRSGAADGADTAFELGAVSAKTGKKDAPDPEIYSPWAGFNATSPQRHQSHFTSGNRYQILATQLSGQCTVVAREHHPNWASLKPAVRWMHTRNVAQVLGPECKTPVEFVICWTPRGAGTGGTGQAIRVARANGIPVYDLGEYCFPFIRRRIAETHGVQI